MKMKPQNLDIQLFKFLYSCVIVLYHLAGNTAITCRGGYMGVEYFLLSAGVFLFLSFRRGEEKGKLQTPVQYLGKRFVRFLPWSATAFLLAAAVQRLWIEPTTSLGGWADHFSRDIWELLMVSMNGINNGEMLLNGPAWTLSAMLIVGFFLWTFLYHYKKPFLHLIMPLTLVAGFGFWMHVASADTQGWIGFTNFGTFRTWIIMCLSFYCIPLSEKLAAYPFNRLGKALLTAVEILIHLFAFLVIFYRATRHWQFLLTALFMLSISIALSGHSYLAKVLEKSRAVSFLGELSMSVYLVHVPVLWVFRHLFDISRWSYWQCVPVFAAVLATAAVHYFVTKWIIWVGPILWRKFLGLITAKEV